MSSERSPVAGSPVPVDPRRWMQSVRARVRARSLGRDAHAAAPLPAATQPSERWVREFLASVVAYRESASFDQGKTGWRAKTRTRLLRFFPFYSRYAENLLEKLTLSLNLLGEVTQEQLARLNSQASRLQALSESLRRLQSETAIGFPSLEENVHGESVSPLPGYDPVFYSRFSLTDDEMLQKFRGYLPLLPADGPILEIGAGTGLFLEVCREAGLDAWGFDASPAAVESCRRRQLQVEKGAVPQYLADLPPHSATCVAAFQVVEHLPLKYLYDTLAHCFRILTPGGRLILETINPESAYAVALSYRSDPSHRILLHPRLLAYAAERFGFRDPVIKYAFPLEPALGDASLLSTDGELTAALKRLSDQVFGFHDYALIASKPAIRGR
jgi:SAM-dependent methyltransferase